MVLLRRHILLLALLWLMASAAALAQEPVGAADDFCAPPRSQSQLRCPKTSAKICLCSLSGKAAQAEAHLEEVSQTVTRVKLPRANRRCRVLPQAEYAPTLITFTDSVPTPPPRF